ncbi:ABC transporter substrate-binding protein [Paenibacillus mesotrionivorans]|uniref:ABC transporter substrate-binding protein n=1 Tax=Paenibacillus mesotrionivorans TaxID=3160968 RepID=A0ACC7P2V8_9BACL
MKKKLYGILAGIMTAALLATACSSGTGNSGDQASPGATTAATTAASGTPGGAKAPVKLKFWGGVPPESGPQEVVDTWNKANPDIQVEYVRFVNDDAGNLKLDTAVMTGQGVDIFVNYSFARMEQRQSSGSTLDLSQFTDFNILEKVGDGAKEFMINGKFYGLPTTKGVSFMWLNMDAFKEANLPIPYDWTWEEARDYAKKLNKKGRWGLLQWNASIFNPVDRVFHEEGHVVNGKSNFGSANAKYGMELLHGMMHTDKTTPLLGEQLATKMPVDTMFLKGEGAMFNAGTWIFRNANNIQANPRTFKVAFAPIPRYSFQKSLLSEGGLGDIVSINSASAHKEEAWKFLKWYTDEGILYMVPGGRIPVSKDVNLDKVISLLLKGVENLYDHESLKRVLFGNIPYFTRKIEQPVMDMRQEEMEKYLLNANTLEKSTATLIDRHNTFIQQKK